MDSNITGGPARAVERRGRGPSPTKTAATRRALVDAGLAVFLDRGYAAARMSDVAARAGLGKGTAYLHFADKPALFAEVLRRFVLDAAGGRPLGRPRRDEPTAAFVRRAVLPVLRGIQAGDRFRVLQLVMAEGARFPELAAIYRSVAIEPVLRLVRVLAARAARRGELRADALARLPILLAAPVIIGALWNAVFARDEPLDVAALLEGFVELVFAERGDSAEGTVTFSPPVVPLPNISPARK